jgi:tetratricopeptide (TPR) repeat protein
MDRGSSTQQRKSNRFPDPVGGDRRPSGTATIVPAARAAGLAEPLLARGGNALDLDGDLHASRRWFEQAYQVAEQSGDLHALTRAVLGLAGIWVHEHRATPAAVALEARLHNALSLAEPGSADALRLRVRMAGENDYRNGEHAAILTALDEATRAGDPVARATALSLAHHCVLGPDHGALRLWLATELIAESFHTGRRSDLLMGMLWRTVDLFLDADPHAERSLGELRDLLAQHDHLAVGFVVSAIEVMMTIRAGQFDEAEGLLKVCADRGAAAGDIDVEGWSGGHLVAIRWYQGRLAELLPVIDELVHSPSLSAVDNSYFAVLAVAAAQAGDRRKAAGALARLCGHDLADLARSSTWLVTMSGAVEAAYLLGDADTAARAYELLSPYGHLPMMASLGVACFGSAQYALGTAALTAGDVDKAIQHLRDAVDHNLAIAHWPAVMMSRVRYAQALAQRSGPDDAETARQEVATATREAAALGTPLPGAVASDEPMQCTRHGRSWRVALGSRSVTVEHSIGLLHLAVLIVNPGQEIPAIDLVAGVEAITGGSAQPVLDRTAIKEYRHRLAQLRTEIDELEARSETRRALEARAERDWLIAALSGANAMGDRTRRFTDDPERARIAVGKAIRRAIARIADGDAVIGESLRSRIRTGIRCSYWPA